MDAPKVSKRTGTGKSISIFIVAVIVVVIIGLVASLYLYQGRSPSKQVGETNMPNKGSSPKKFINPGTSLRYLEANSFYSGYSLKLSNKEEIIKLLESWFVYGKTYVSNGSQSTLDTPLTTVQFTIRDKRPNGWKPVFGDSTYLFLSPGFLEINFYLTNDQITKADVGDYILKEFIKDVYKTVYPSASENSVAQKVEDGYKSLKSKNTTYVSITKK